MTSNLRRPVSSGDPEPRADCILHSGMVCKRTRYGLIYNHETQRTELAHRVAWRNAYGSIPDGAFICHRCDVRLCVNPAHLFDGNHRDNMMDMRSKGRGRAPFMSDDGSTRRTWAEEQEENGEGCFSGVDNWDD